MKVTLIPLGAGQEVGRSCILLNFWNEKRILLDCGVHMGYSDNKRYPDFDLLISKAEAKDINGAIDLCLISHFHLDHCAALPVLTEEFKFDGPIIASEPTKAIFPYMLEDFMRVSQDRQYPLTRSRIENCAGKIKCLGLLQTKEYCGVSITSYYAGHVLGAVMFAIKYKGVSVVYTGDYNTKADRHLGGCKIASLKPDILISESTYATVTRDWRKEREAQFETLIRKTFERGGKVLIPTFAMGRAQELFALIEDLWKRCGWQYPVYYSARLTDKVRFYYRLFASWLNEGMKSELAETGSSPFMLEHIQKYEKGYGSVNTPMLVLATPGMLHGGSSLEIFKEWANDKRNSLLIPGYCLPGTVGGRLLAGERSILIDGEKVEVNLEVARMSFSAHADSNGIMSLIKHLQPKNLVFVHGEKLRMEYLAKLLIDQEKLPSFCPANFEELEIKVKIKSKAIPIEWEAFCNFENLQNLQDISNKAILDAELTGDKAWLNKEIKIDEFLLFSSKCNLQTGSLVLFKHC